MGERERQLRARQSILQGETPEKRIFIANEDKEFKEKMRLEREVERKKSNEKFEALKGARMPWFCGKCKKIMKKHLDEKMWYLYNHCFECQVDIENKLRISGKFDEWAQQKVIANKLSWIRDQKQSVEEFKKQDKVEFWEQIRPDGYSVDKEKWNTNFDSVKKESDKALEYLQKIEDFLK